MKQNRTIIHTRGSLNAKVALQYLKNQNSVNLSEYAWIEVDAAMILSGRTVYFNLSSIKNHFLLWYRSSDSPYGCALNLNGLTDITVEVARALATHKGLLYLDGLTNITVEVARALATHKGFSLQLRGLTDISVEVARILATHKGILDLRDVID